MLDSAGEDVWGLWEVLGGIRTEFAGREEAELRALATGAVRALIDEGLVEVRRGRGLDDEQDTVPADPAQLEWEPAGEQPSYLTLHITPAGERAYYDR